MPRVRRGREIHAAAEVKPGLVVARFVVVAFLGSPLDRQAFHGQQHPQALDGQALQRRQERRFPALVRPQERHHEALDGGEERHREALDRHVASRDVGAQHERGAARRNWRSELMPKSAWATHSVMTSASVILRRAFFAR
ncbi:MAG: hypothetical protein ACJ756_05195, partial [Solirubrobacterales bacterium]